MEFAESRPSHFDLFNDKGEDDDIKCGPAAVKMISNFCNDTDQPVSIKLSLPYNTKIELFRPGSGALSRILNGAHSDFCKSHAPLGVERDTRLA